jgi:hypothetical protein
MTTTAKNRKFGGCSPSLLTFFRLGGLGSFGGLFSDMVNHANTARLPLQPDAGNVSRLVRQQGRRAKCKQGDKPANAAMEPLRATFKTECFGDYIPGTRQEARLMIFDYIEGFYNSHRLHS